MCCGFKCDPTYYLKSKFDKRDGWGFIILASHLKNQMCKR